MGEKLITDIVNIAGASAETVAEETSIGATLSEAGIHTLLGMGIVFFTLILISIVISLFSIIGKANRKKITETAVKPERAEVNTEAGNHGELISVITAAIAMYQSENQGTDQSGFYVRSIRKVSGKNVWRKAE